MAQFLGFWLVTVSYTSLLLAGTNFLSISEYSKDKQGEELIFSERFRIQDLKHIDCPDPVSNSPPRTKMLH